MKPPQSRVAAPPRAQRRRHGSAPGTRSNRTRSGRDGRRSSPPVDVEVVTTDHRDLAEGLGSPIAPLANWNPTRRPPRHPVRAVPYALLNPTRLDDLKNPARWELVAIESAEGLGHVRNGITYAQDYTTCGSMFEKPRRIQFMEGPNEPAIADHLELCPRYIDFQFQPLALLFRRADGVLIRKYPDVAYEIADHRVVFGEIKSNDAWFAAEGVRRPLERVSLALEASGLGPIHRIKGEPFRRDETVEAHSIAMEARLTAFDPEADGTAARQVIMAGGGRTRYADVVGALGGPASVGADKLYAMLLRRIVDFDLRCIPTADTIVTAPRPVAPYALRELLGRFERKAA
ncbi:hypothetical protein LQ953_03285 [Sphingomonas sp. IC-56]|uniref:hypothetical protein n=1 Tax=Sphingomonas sp. IC-56 TaxID=2898529 RepID=UPI001E2E06B1|nr:hypothetical protein [Sphingomonas sp. IC-56]MCD2323036.1 hypothetical protein [Sphingomonas sp. IC-56]